jgi:hypothetical protein
LAERFERPPAISCGPSAHLGCTEAHFNLFITEIRAYRDKFVAHLDSQAMDIPVMDMAKASALYYPLSS